MSVEVHVIQLETEPETIKEMWETYPAVPDGNKEVLDARVKELLRRAFYAGCCDMFRRLEINKVDYETKRAYARELIDFSSHVISSEKESKSREAKDGELHIGLDVCRPTDESKTGYIVGICADLYLVNWRTPGGLVESKHYAEELRVLL